MEKKKQLFDTELGALFNALEIAIKETKNVSTTPVTVFIDFRAALTKIQKKASEPKGLTVRNLIHRRAKKLIANGHSVTLR